MNGSGTDRRPWRRADPKRRMAAAGLVRTVAEVANAATSLEDGLAGVLPILCRHLGWPVGHAFLVEGDTLRSTDLWYLEGDPARFERFRERTGATPGCPDACLVAGVVHSGRASWIPDARTEPGLLRAGSDAVIRSGLLLPVRCDGEIPAVLELWADEVVEREAEILEVMEAVGTQLGVVALRERSRAFLEASEARLGEILDISADAVLALDSEGRIALFNAGAEATFGYSREEVLGEPVERLVPDGLRDTRAEGVRAVVSADQDSGSVVGGPGLDLRGRHRDGHTFPVKARIARVTGPPDPLYAVVLRDVTEERRVAAIQRALAEAGEVFASSLDAVETVRGVARVAVGHLAECCGIYLFDETGGVERVEFACAEGGAGDCHLARGWRASEATSRLVSGSAGGAPVLLTRDETRNLLGSDSGAVGTVLLVPVIAHERPLGSMVLIRRAGRESFGDGEVELATELARRTAIALEAAELFQTTRRAVHTRDEILGMVCHDLGTPVSAVAMVVDRLLRQAPEDDRRVRTRSYLEGLRTSVSQMERLIRDLLDVRQIEAGRFVVEPIAQPLNPILWAAVSGMEARAGQDAVEVLSPDDGLRVRADRDRLIQLLWNLLSNARRVSPPDSPVRVEAIEAGDEVVITVLDRGPGIPPDQVPYLFDRFAQARRVRRVGAGLGLTIAREIAEAHGGRMWVDTEVGVGSAFRFTLPRVRPQALERVPRPKAVAGRNDPSRVRRRGRNDPR